MDEDKKMFRINVTTPIRAFSLSHPVKEEDEKKLDEIVTNGYILGQTLNKKSEFESPNLIGYYSHSPNMVLLSPITKTFGVVAYQLIDASKFEKVISYHDGLDVCFKGTRFLFCYNSDNRLEGMVEPKDKTPF